MSIKVNKRHKYFTIKYKIIIITIIFVFFFTKLNIKYDCYNYNFYFILEISEQKEAAYAIR